MSKKFAGQVSLLVLINLFVKLVWVLGIERNVQLSVGFNDYGAYYTLFSFSLILSIISDPGLSNYLIRHLSQNGISNKTNSELLFLKIVLSLIYLGSTCGLGLVLGYKHDYFNLLLILAGYQVAWQFLTYLRGFLKGLHLFNAEIFFSVLDKVLLFLLFIPLLIYDFEISRSIFFFAYSQLIAVVITIIACSIFLKQQKVSIFRIEKIRLNFGLLKEVWPFTLFAFLVLIYNKIDVVMLEQILGDELGKEEAGVYAAANRLLDASNMICVLFTSLFFPTISKLISNDKKIDKIVSSSFGILISFTIIIALSSWFYRRDLMVLLYGEESNRYVSGIFAVLMLNSPLLALYHIYSSVLIANNNLKQLNIISAFCVGINIVLNIFLIPQYRAFGATISSVLTLMLVTSLYSIFYHNYFKVRFNFLSSIKVAGLILVLLVTYNLLEHIHIYWFISILIFIVVGFTFSYFTRLMNVKKLFGFIKQSN